MHTATAVRHGQTPGEAASPPLTQIKRVPPGGAGGAPRTLRGRPSSLKGASHRAARDGLRHALDPGASAAPPGRERGRRGLPGWRAAHLQDHPETTRSAHCESLRFEGIANPVSPGLSRTPPTIVLTPSPPRPKTPRASLGNGLPSTLYADDPPSDPNSKAPAGPHPLRRRTHPGGEPLGVLAATASPTARAAGRAAGLPFGRGRCP